MAQGRPERKDADTLLGASLAWGALAVLPTCVLILDEQGRVIYCNPAWLRLRGRGPVGVGAREGDDYLAKVRSDPADAGAEIAGALDRTLHDARSPLEIEYPVQTKRGRRWFRTQAWRLEGCGPARLVVAHSPVTRCREGEAALQESRDRLDSILRAAPAGIGVAVNRTVAEANDRLCRMTGYERSELVGQNARMLYPTDEDYEYVGREKYAQIARQGTGTVETRWRRKDGRVIDVLLSSTPIHPGDLSQGVTFTALDITSHKAAMAALRQSEQEKSLILDTAQEMFVFYDRDLRVQWANKAAAQAAGLAREEMAGQTCKDVWERRERKCEDCPVKRALETGQPQQGEICFDNGESWFMRGYPVRQDKGGVSGVISFALDVTAAKRAERLLRLQYDLSQSLMDASSVAEGTERILDAALRLPHCDGGGFFLVDAGTGAVVLAAHRGLGEQLPRAAARFAPDSPQAVMARQGKPLYGAWRDLAPGLTEFETRAGFRRCAVLPAMSGGEPVAVLAIASRSPDAFADEERRALEVIALQAGEMVVRLQAKETLNESERKHRALFETMAQGVVYQAADGAIVAANPAAERILGLTLDQLTGRMSRDPRWRAIHEDGSDFPGEDHPSMTALRTGREVRGVIMGVFNPRENAHRWIQVHAIPQFRPGEDKPFQVYTTFEDITLRKAAEDALRAKTEELNQFFSVALDLFAIADSREGRFRRLNAE
ncbi:MAG TPA: PAS domain S-box protein [Candidatus Brocadiia bacterium]|nr:PAS domain S-box protein [Candidatus Brocadiia bacterium]